MCHFRHVRALSEDANAGSETDRGQRLRQPRCARARFFEAYVSVVYKGAGGLRFGGWRKWELGSICAWRRCSPPACCRGWAARATAAAQTLDIELNKLDGRRRAVHGLAAAHQPPERDARPGALRSLRVRQGRGHRPPPPAGHRADARRQDDGRQLCAHRPALRQCQPPARQRRARCARPRRAPPSTASPHSTSPAARQSRWRSSMLARPVEHTTRR